VNFQKEVNIITNSLANYFIEGNWTQLNYGLLKHLLKNTNCEYLSDSVIANNEDVFNNIDLKTLSKMKILRIISRNVELLKKINFQEYGFTLKEARYLLIRKPEIIEDFHLDFNILPKSDAFLLLSMGIKLFFDKINMMMYSFTSKEYYTILKAHGFENYIFKNIKLKLLRQPQIVSIIKHTGEKYIKCFNLLKITAKGWCDIFELQSHLLPYINTEVFKEGDIFYAVKLIELFENEDFSYLIKERKNYRELLTPLGWEKLIISKPDEFIDECVFWKMNSFHWSRILLFHPHLIAYKD